jgi:hypothetical protein
MTEFKELLFVYRTSFSEILYFRRLMDNNIYLLSDLQTRLNELDSGDINRLRWDFEDSSSLNNWLEQMSHWDAVELRGILNPLLDKVNKILSRDSIIISKVVKPADFFPDPEDASPDRIKNLNLRRREELISYKAFLLRGIKLIKAEIDNEFKGDGELTGLELHNTKIIEKHLAPFKGKNIEEKDYYAFVNALKRGINTQIFEDFEAPVIVTGIKAKDKFGAPMKRIFMDCNPGRRLTYEYLAFAKQNISIFRDVELNKIKFNKCALYRCFTKSA